jgi:oxygen-independent coproporphyrinogen-3 oxidase
MAGIYIHIPFCKKACHYCNFHFSTSADYQERMIQAIAQELMLRRDEITVPIQTIYFGGGTPSIIKPAQIELLLETIDKHYSIDASPEITMEANPDDITKEHASNWKSIGINRFSIGIQSFSDIHLEWMNRAHNASQSLSCIDIIRGTGFENFSIDLIYGTPGQTTKDWERDVEKAIHLKIPHLSCYALTVEEQTPLFHLIKTGKKEKVNSDLQAEQFNLLVEITNAAGYDHYEISNLALPGMKSKHNSSYWNGVPYLGVGPSAHSFQNNMRSWNISNNVSYMQSIEQQSRPFESEILTEIDQLNEYIMTKLRLEEGINTKFIIKKWGDDHLSRITKLIEKFIQEEKVEITQEGWRLTKHGKFFADGIASALFQV